MEGDGGCGGGGQPGSTPQPEMHTSVGMDPARAICLDYRMETTLLVPVGTKGADTGFSFPFVTDSAWTFNQFRSAICDKYPWGLYDAVEFGYWDIDTSVWVPVQCDDELGIMFAIHASFPVKLEISIIQRKRGQTESTGTRSQSTSSRGRSSHSRGRKIAAETSQSQSSQNRVRDARNSSMQVPGTPTKQVPRHAGSTNSRDSADPNIEEGLPDDWPTDDEDERLFPQFVTRKKSKQKDDERGEDYVPPPEGMFDEAGEDEKEEDMDMGYSETSDEEMPDVQYNRDDPSLKEGTIFSSALDSRNALATFSIKTQSEFVIDKSDPSRLTVHCAYKRCKWRMHASLMRNSTLFQVKVNKTAHTCPSVNRRKRLKSAKSRWVADAVKTWILENSNIGVIELHKKLKKKYGLDVPYMRVFYGKQMALDNIYATTDATNAGTEDAIDAENAGAEDATDAKNADPTDVPVADPTNEPVPAPASDATTVANAVSPRKNYKRPAERGQSPLKKKLKCAEDHTLGSVTGSNQLSRSITANKDLSKNISTRRSSRFSSNPVCNTRSKKIKQL